jgi:hypothetical protein
MAELMAQSAQECSKRSDVFANSCPHPDTNLHGIRVIVAEEFRGRVLPNPKWSGCQHADAALRHLIKIRRSSNEVVTDLPDILHVFGFHGRFNRACNFCESSISRQRDDFEAITVHKEPEVCFTRWGVGEHRQSLWHDPGESGTAQAQHFSVATS